MREPPCLGFHLAAHYDVAWLLQVPSGSQGREPVR